MKFPGDPFYKTWDERQSDVAYFFAVNGIPSDNVFFVQTPGFIAFQSEIDGSIMHTPASDLTNLITRRVIFEKCKNQKKFSCYFHRKAKSGDKIVTKPMSVTSYKLNWKEELYREDCDVIELLKDFIKQRSHLALFFYLEDDFLEKIQNENLVRVAHLAV